jgi:hypothetical protein
MDLPLLGINQKWGRQVVKRSYSTPPPLDYAIQERAAELNIPVSLLIINALMTFPGIAEHYEDALQYYPRSYHDYLVPLDQSNHSKGKKADE